VIVTSATLDVERISRFFDDAPIISVSGRAHPISDIRQLECASSFDSSFARRCFRSRLAKVFILNLQRP